MFVKNAVAAAGAAVLFAAMPAVAQESQAPVADVGIVPANVLLAEHSNWFTPAKIYDLAKEHWPLPSYPAELGYEAYSAVGFDLANTILIKGPARDAKGNRELIVIDTLGNPEVSHRTLQAFRAQGILPSCPEFALGQPVPEACKLPLRAIIYTHNHIDHTFGVWGFLGSADRPPCAVADPQVAGADTLLDTAAENRDCVAVIGQYKINDGVATTSLNTGTIIDARSSYMYGSFIPRNHVNSGIGPQELVAFVEVDGRKVAVNGSYRMPSRTFDNELKVIAAGVQMQLIYVPSETNDELAVFLPDRRNRTGTPPSDDDWSGPGLLQSAEVIQGPSFPNLYSLRGTAYRDPANWFRSVDRLRQFDSWCMLPSHGPPLCDAALDDVDISALRIRHKCAARHEEAGLGREVDLGLQSHPENEAGCDRLGNFDHSIYQPALRIHHCGDRSDFCEKIDCAVLWREEPHRYTQRNRRSDLGLNSQVHNEPIPRRKRGDD